MHVATRGPPKVDANGENFFDSRPPLFIKFILCPQSALRAADEGRPDCEWHAKQKRRTHTEINEDMESIVPFRGGKTKKVEETPNVRTRIAKKYFLCAVLKREVKTLYVHGCSSAAKRHTSATQVCFSTLVLVLILTDICERFECLGKRVREAREGCADMFFIIIFFVLALLDLF